MGAPWELNWSEPDQGALEDIISGASERYGIPEDRLRAVIAAESNFNPQAVSKAGAQGLMQLMPGTARDLGVTDAFDPAQNVDAGARYLAQLRDKYGDWDTAHAAYNFGPSNIDKGKALPEETRGYLQRINARVAPGEKSAARSDGEGEPAAPWEMEWDAKPDAKADAAPWDMPWAEQPKADEKTVKPIETVIDELAAMPLPERAARIAAGIPAGAVETAAQMAAQVPQMAFQVGGFVKALSEGKMTREDFDRATQEITPDWVKDLAEAHAVQPETYAGALMSHGLGEAISAAGRVAAAPGAGLKASVEAALAGEGTEGARERFKKSFEETAPVTEQVLNAGILGKMGLDAAGARARGRPAPEEQAPAADAGDVLGRPVDPLEDARGVMDAASVDEAIAKATESVDRSTERPASDAFPPVEPALEPPPLSPDELATARITAGADDAIARREARDREADLAQPLEPDRQLRDAMQPPMEPPSPLEPVRQLRSQTEIVQDRLDQEERARQAQALRDQIDRGEGVVEVPGGPAKTPGARDVTTMTPRELEMAARLTRSEDRRAELNAERVRRAAASRPEPQGLVLPPDVEVPNARAVEGESAPAAGAEATRAAAAAAEAATPPQGAVAERRIDLAQRKRVADMSPDERGQALLTNEKSRLPNERAYQEAPKRAVQGSIDLDDFKAVNDTMGHPAGDIVLAKVGEALRDGLRTAGVETYHFHGDEFHVQADNVATARAALDQVRLRLAGADVTVKLPDGRTVTKKGLGFSYGLGETIDHAEAALRADKTQRARVGLRGAGRGEPARVALEAPPRQPGRRRAVAPAPEERVTSEVLEPGPVKETPAQAGVSASGLVKPAARAGSPVEGGGTAARDLQQHLAPAIERSRVPVRIVENESDVPFPVEPGSRGQFHQGQVWLIAKNLSDRVEAEHTLLRHELVHAGYDILYGADRGLRARALQRVLDRNENVRGYASQWRKQFGREFVDDLVGRGMERERAHEEMVLRSKEEGIAYFSETKAPITGFRQFIATIQRGLRAAGLDGIANRLEKLTDAEAMSEIARILRATDAPRVERLRAPQPAFAARRLFRGVRAVGDFVVPETPDYAGNMSGDLARITEKAAASHPRIEALPIRLPVGATRGGHKGFGLEHMRVEAEAERKRAPRAHTQDLAENFARDVADVARTGNKLYYDERNDRVILQNKAGYGLVMESRPREAPEYYGVVTMFKPTKPDFWGRPAWVGRADLPTTEAPHSVAPEPSPGRSSSDAKPSIAGVQTERFQFTPEKGGGEPPKAAARLEADRDKPLSPSGPIDSLLAHLGGRALAEHVTKPIYDRVLELASRVTPEKVKAGIVSDYGLTDLYVDRRNELRIAQRQGVKQAQRGVELLAGLDRAQSRVAYQWMTERDAAGDALLKDLPEEKQATLRKLKDTITDLGREAVALGQLSPEAFARNQNAYLHRTYAKFELDDTKQQKVARARAIRILGEQYKGRGMVDRVSPDSVRGGVERGAEFVRLERRNAEGRLQRVVYVRADKAIAKQYEGWTRDPAKWETRFVPEGEGDIGMWRDFSKEERQRMGELDEVKFAVAKTLIMMTRDVETGRFLRWINDTYAKASADGLQVAETPTGNALATFDKNTWVQVPETKIPGTQTLRFGDLAGKYIPSAMWNDLRQVTTAQFNPLGDVLGSIMRMWKISKTALSPTVHVNNVMSNFVLADMADVGAHDLVRATKVFADAKLRKDAEAQKLLDRYDASGGELGAYALSELQQKTLDPLLEQLRADVEKADGNAGLASAAAAVSAIFHGKVADGLRELGEAARGSTSGRIGAKVLKSFIEVYQSEDQAFRFAAWLKAVKEGKSDLEAGKIAREAFLDYNINAPWIQNLRATVLPFIAFAYRATPMLARAAAEKPWKLAKYAAIAGGLNAMAYAALGLTSKDEKRERALLPEEKSGKIWGVFPRLMRMPWNMSDKGNRTHGPGNPVFLDIRRWIPVGDVIDFGQNHPAVPVPASLFPGGPLVAMGELMLNRKAFDGKPIALETDTPRERSAKVLKYLYQTGVPNAPWVPFSYSYDNIRDAGKGKTDAFGREMNMSQAVESSFGVKEGSYPTDVLRRNVEGKLKAEVQELDMEFAKVRRQYQRNGLSKAEFDAEMANYTEKKRKLREEASRKLGDAR